MLSHHLRQMSSLTMARSLLRGPSSSHAVSLLRHHFWEPAATTQPPPISSAASIGSATTTRGFSSIRSASPSYTVFGEKCMLNLKIILPDFRLSPSNYLLLDNSRKGRILLEWTPRIEGGTSLKF